MKGLQNSEIELRETTGLHYHVPRVGALDRT